MPWCICQTNCYLDSKRYRPGDRAFFDEIPPHFKSEEKLAKENQEKVEQAKPKTEKDFDKLAEVNKVPAQENAALVKENHLLKMQNGKLKKKVEEAAIDG